MSSISIFSLSFSLSLPRYLHLAFFRSFDRPQVFFTGEWTTSRRRQSFPFIVIDYFLPLHRRLIEIRHPVPSFSRPSDILSFRPKNGAFRNSRGHTENKSGGEAWRSTKLWQVEDERPPRRSTSRHRVYGIALHAWLARRSKETNRFTFVPVAECLGTICPDNIAAGTLFMSNEMRIVVPFLLYERACGEGCGVDRSLN